MALAYLSTTLSMEEYLELRTKQNVGTGRMTRGAYNNVRLFCLDQYGREFTTVLVDLQKEILSTNQLDSALILMQKFITWSSESHEELKMSPSAVGDGAPCMKKDVLTIRGYIGQMRLMMKKVGGIPISSEDVKDYKLSYPVEADKEDPEPMELEEFRLICDNQTDPRRQMLYRIMKDNEARIGAMVQLRKKNFNTTVRPIAVTYPKSIMKKKNGIAFTNVKYVTKENEKGLLKLLEKCDDEDLVFGTNEKVDLAVNNEEKTWSRLVQSLGFTARYKHNNHLKKNIHSVKSLTFTAARKAVDADYAHAYGDHAEYCKNYLRLTEDEKIGYFKKLEPFISMYQKTEYVHDTPELLEENNELKEKIISHDELLEKISEKIKNTTAINPKANIKKIFKELLKENNLI
jgi:hypothetical protein